MLMINLAASPLAALLGPMNIGLIELFVLLLALPIGIFWIWALVDCVTKEPDTGNNKLIWVIVIVLAGIIGAVIYIAVRRPQRRAETGR